MGNSLDPNDHPVRERKFRLATTMTQEKLAQVDPDEVVHVMSYNVLANRLATIDKFSHTTRSVLHFSFRGPRIMQEMA